MIRKREGSKAFEFHINCLPPVARAAVLKKQGVIEVAGNPIEIKKTPDRQLFPRAALAGLEQRPRQAA
ncbi:DNA-binding protein [Xenorhabdus nematophila]|uniref:DNA-binding protein n=1 Tax=Xenorhabdus nematophila TaxID=628 RepID=UPI000907758C|nr:DNA-binding protein [Xenorhabdus nematophila]